MRTQVRTQDVVSAYFQHKKEYESRIRVLNNPYIYDYEKRLGKSLFEFSPLEIVDMLSTFTIGGKTNQRTHSVTSLEQTKSQLRNLFTFYSNNYERIPNPIDSNEFNEAFEKMLLERTQVLTNEDVEKIVALVYEYHNIDRATIIECIIRLCLDGCEGGADIIRIKEDMIDFQENVIYLPDKQIILSPKTSELLQEEHSMQAIIARYPYEMESWDGSYFKLPTRRKDGFASNNALDMSRKINTILSQCFINDSNLPILKYQDFYLLGIYNRFVSEYGYEDAKNIIVNQSRTRVNDFMRIMEMYGIPYSSMTNYKRRLKKYFSA